MSLSINAIWDAIEALEREADFRWNVGGSGNFERYRDLKRDAKRAMVEYRQLSEALPRLRGLMAEADRQYDHYVTREPVCCSCHISAPCSFCTCEDTEQRP